MPSHVRAASGLAVVAGKLLVIQDDAAFLAVVDGASVEPMPLAPGAVSQPWCRDKATKLDLEACVAVDDALWVFGSGSTPRREHVVITGIAARAADARVLYAALRASIGS